MANTIAASKFAWFMVLFLTFAVYVVIVHEIVNVQCSVVVTIVGRVVESFAPVSTAVWTMATDNCVQRAVVKQGKLYHGSNPPLSTQG